MEKAETQHTETEDQKYVAVDFSSELGRFMRSQIIPKKVRRISHINSEGFGASLERKDTISPRWSTSNAIHRTPSLRLPRIDFSGGVLKKMRIIFARAIRTVARPVMREGRDDSISTLRHAADQLRQISARALKVLDNFSNLPVWITMPVIFVLSVILGAALSIFFGF